jgi:hypothetical protein
MSVGRAVPACNLTAFIFHGRHAEEKPTELPVAPQQASFELERQVREKPAGSFGEIAFAIIRMRERDSKAFVAPPVEIDAEVVQRDAIRIQRPAVPREYGKVLRQEFQNLLELLQRGWCVLEQSIHRPTPAALPGISPLARSHQ